MTGIIVSYLVGAFLMAAACGEESTKSEVQPGAVAVMVIFWPVLLAIQTAWFPFSLAYEFGRKVAK